MRSRAKFNKSHEVLTLVEALSIAYYTEADRVAAQVVNQINASVSQQSSQNLQHEYPAVQRNTRPWLRLQAKDGGMAAPAKLESSIQQARSGGQPLADNVKKPMQQALGLISVG